MKQRGSKEQRFIINDKVVIPENDILLCDVRDETEEFTINVTYARLYVTESRFFYKIVKTRKRTDIKEVTQEEAKQYMNENVAYIKTDGYIAVFGEPERG